MTSTQRTKTKHLPLRLSKKIGVYWRNDQPGGFGLISIIDPRLDIEIVREALNEADEEFAANDDQQAYAQRLLTGLSAIGESSPADRRNHWASALTAIHVLTRFGYLQIDEFNGIIYVFEDERGQAISRRALETALG